MNCETIKEKVESGCGACSRVAEALWRTMKYIGKKRPRDLHLCESLPLGERRFIAVVEFEGSRFLVGGTSTSLVLLTKLESPRCSNESTVSAAIGGELH